MNDLLDNPMREYSGRVEAGRGRSIDYCIKTPAFGGLPGISRFYASRSRILEERIKGSMKSALSHMSEGQWRVEGSFYSTYASERLLSVSGEVYEDRGLMGDRLTRLSEIWDLNTGRIVPLLSLARSPKELYSLMRRRTQEEIFALEGETPGSFYHIPLPFYDGAFLTESGIAWWYRRGSIAPRSGGIPTFTLSREKLAGHLIFDL